jgi:hypothetical protein
MKKIHAWLAAILLTAGLGLVTPSMASAAPYCGQVWGSLAKTNAAMSAASIFNVRTGQHTCFDRLVVDINGPAGGYNVQYVSVVTENARGGPVPLRGGAFLQVVVHANDYDINTGLPTYRRSNKNELANVSGYQTFRQVAFAGSFEGYTDFGLGVRARLPFRFFTLAGPGTGSRLVIDVAHRW